ncbi:MAG: flagellar assembly protein FliW [Desulfotomaculum sp.]|nr:flagellar assembly protein FliW [Desulfotomaculum sp.]
MPENVVTFKSGLPGLPAELTEFQLLAVEQNSPFFLLKSVVEETICFIVINPFNFLPEYQFELPAAEKNKLNLNDQQNTAKKVAIFCIVNVSEGLPKATVNLMAPLVVNTETNQAKQIVLSGDQYAIRHPLPVDGLQQSVTAEREAK